MARVKTKYPGVYYREARRIGHKGTEKVFYVTFKKDGKTVEEKVGRQFTDDMTEARAAGIRADRIEGKRPSRKELKAAEEAKKQAEADKWTIGRLADQYFENRPENKAKGVDKNRYDKYLKDAFEKKDPGDLVPLDLDRLRIGLVKKGLSPQTVKHVLNLLTWIINYGAKKSLCVKLAFHIEKPRVNNIVTEDLTQEQLKALLKAIDEHKNIQIKNLVRLALFTGMRRGELFKLQWDHIDFERGQIRLVAPKGGVDQTIPLNDAARNILENHPRPQFRVKGEKKEYRTSPFVFPGAGGRQRVSAQAGVNEIKKAAGLPKNFRPLHGLRHSFASMLASSGEVDMYHLQRLLTHKSPMMTQRYAHLRDEALKKASNLAGDLIQQAIKEEEKDKNNVIEIKPA